MIILYHGLPGLTSNSLLLSSRQILIYRWVYYIRLLLTHQNKVLALYINEIVRSCFATDCTMKSSQARYSVALLLTSATCCGISSMQSIVYHQNEVLYIIIAKAIQPAVDDIRLQRWYPDQRSDDIPLLSQWIKKEVTFGRQKLLLFWWNRGKSKRTRVRRMISRYFSGKIGDFTRFSLIFSHFSDCHFRLIFVPTPWFLVYKLTTSEKQYSVFFLLCI